jgi:hypothetical protein
MNSHGQINTIREGGCQCGAVRYQCPDQPLALYVCHCLECRHQSASAFGISYIVARSDLQLLHGQESIKFWTRNTDSGRILECVFCKNCGSRLWHQYPELSDPVSIKGGSLDQATDISQAIHIWTQQKLEGVIIPEGSQQFSSEPV